jgi:hypothetical protein
VTPVLALLQGRAPDDWFQWILFLAFFGLPLLARVLRALKGGKAEVEEAETAAERRRRAAEERAEQESREAEGEDLWKRLARGELAETPPPLAREESPPPVPAPVARGTFEQTLEERTSETFAPEESSLEVEAEPAPLSVLGDVREPAEAPESSLEAAGEPAPLAVLGELGGAAAVSAAARVAPARPGRGLLASGDWRRAIVLSEILGPPVSERRRA